MLTLPYLLESARAFLSNTTTAFGGTSLCLKEFLDVVSDMIGLLDGNLQLNFLWFFHCFSCSVFSVFNFKNL